jgi:hypothetical protein
MYYVRRDLDKAEKLCTESAQSSGSYPHWVGKSLILLADVYAERNDLSTAQAALESVIENNADDKELVKEAQEKLDQYKGKSKTKSKLRASGDDGKLDLDEGNK